MLLEAPTTIIEPLFEAVLEPDLVDGTPLRGDGDHGDASPDRIGRELPTVSIGRPVSWPLADLFGGELPALLADGQDEFRLVRLACSFRAGPRDGRVEWARFTVDLRPDVDGRQPIAFDLHPLTEVQTVTRDLKVGIAPTLKFNEIEGALGHLESGISYTELLPVVSGNGIGEATPSWDFTAVRGTQVAGTRCMHLIVRSPAGLRTAMAGIELTADVVGPGARIPMILRRRRQEDDRLDVPLWGDASPGKEES